MIANFSYPLRPWSRFYSAAAFLDPHYLAERGRWHRGVDLNLLSGGDSDLGYPVSSIFPGTVTASAVYGSWGGIVVVEADEWVRRYVSDTLEWPIEVLEVQYAHLLHLPLPVGARVNAGECVGAMGKGTYGQYLAHLHLEVRTTRFAPDKPQGGEGDDRDFCFNNCLDPLRVLTRLCSDEPNVLAQRCYVTPSRVLELSGEGQQTLVHPVGDKLYLERF